MLPNNKNKISNNDQASVVLNNAGIGFLHNGDLVNALANFREALSSEMGYLHSKEEEEENRQSSPVKHGTMISSDDDESSPSSSSSSMAVEGVMTDEDDSLHQSHSAWQLLVQSIQTSVSTTTSCNASKITSTLCTAPFVHARGIHIVDTPGAYSDDPIRNSSCVSAIIIFNLALVYHMKSMVGTMNGPRNNSCSRQSQCLTKARSLYEHSLMLLHGVHSDHDHVSETMDPNPVLDLLCMALFNNLAHIGIELSNYEDSKIFFDELIGYACTVVPSAYRGGRRGGHDESLLCSMMEQCKKTFLLNAMILNAPPIAPAA